MAQAQYQWRALLPTTGKGTAPSDSDVDWDIPNEGMDIQYSSLYITGKLAAQQGGTNIGTADIQYNRHAGIHGFFRQFSSSTTGGIENLNNYGHMVTMLSENSSFYQELFAETDKNMELRVGEQSFTTQILKGQTATDYAVAFAFKPIIALNFSMDAKGQPLNLSFQSLGTIRLRTRLASVRQALFGADCSAANTTFSISDLQLHYQVVPAGKPQPTTFMIFNDTVRPVNSNNVNLNAQMPGLTSSFSSHFIPVADETDYTKDAYRTAVLPNVTRVQFAYNGNDNVKIAFPLETPEEIQYNYQLSLGNTGVNSLLLSSRQLPSEENSGYGIGLNFGQLQSLIKTTFSLNILSSVSNLAPYSAYMFFRSLVTV